MAEFGAAAELDLVVPGGQLSGIRAEIENELSEIEVGLDASVQNRPSGNRMAGRERAMGRQLQTRSMDLDEERNALLEEILDGLEGDGGGGGGGGLIAGGSRLLGGLGVAAAGLLGGAAALSLGGAAERMDEQDAINLGSGATGAGRSPIDPTNPPDWFTDFPAWWESTFGGDGRTVDLGPDPIIERSGGMTDPGLTPNFGDRPNGVASGSRGRNIFRREDPSLNPNRRTRNDFRREDRSISASVDASVTITDDRSFDRELQRALDNIREQIRREVRRGDVAGSSADFY